VTGVLLCLDIGGSTIRAGYSASPDALVAVAATATPPGSYDAFLQAIVSIMRSAPGPLTGISVSITGVMDPVGGRLTCANIPCVDGRFLAQDLHVATGLPVMIENDADCFALAEAAAGAGRGHENVFSIILGSGVGGALVIRNRVVKSPLGYAGEWGHGVILATTVGDPPRLIPALACGCGRSGCVNTIGGARGLEALHRLLSGEERTSHDILSGWHAGSDMAQETLAAYLELVSQPLAYALNITGSSIVIAGGGLASDHQLVAALDLAVRSRMLAMPTDRLIVPAQLGDRAGLLGAAIAGHRDTPRG
jgi:N-acetylglucosamine kinase